jgi:hypothetical protein
MVEDSAAVAFTCPEWVAGVARLGKMDAPLAWKIHEELAGADQIVEIV